MAQIIDIPDSAWSSQDVTLAGITYTFVFTFNDTDTTWGLDIYQNGTPIKLGCALKENRSLLSKYSLPLFNHGDLFFARILDDGNLPKRDNVGKGKSYQLLYYSFSELGFEDV